MEKKRFRLRFKGGVCRNEIEVEKKKRGERESEVGCGVVRQVWGDINIVWRLEGLRGIVEPCYLHRCPKCHFT